MPEARFHAVLGGNHHLDLRLDLPTDFPAGAVEIIVRPTQPVEPPAEDLETLFAAIERILDQ